MKGHGFYMNKTSISLSLSLSECLSIIVLKQRFDYNKGVLTRNYVRESPPTISADFYRDQSPSSVNVNSLSLKIDRLLYRLLKYRTGSLKLTPYSPRSPVRTMILVRKYTHICLPSHSHITLVGASGEVE